MPNFHITIINFKGSFNFHMSPSKSCDPPMRIHYLSSPYFQWYLNFDIDHVLHQGHICLLVVPHLEIGVAKIWAVTSLLQESIAPLPGPVSKSKCKDNFKYLLTDVDFFDFPKKDIKFSKINDIDYQSVASFYSIKYNTFC